MDKINSTPVSDTERKILEAAKKVFLNKGFDGASMQDIADEAGINKALLHYYFRKKEFLFLAIFKEAFSQLVPMLLNVMQSEFPIQKKIQFFINSYMDLLINNPHLPIFVFHELQQRPENLVELIREHGFQPSQMLKKLSAEVETAGGIKYPPEHLFVNILALCIFPIVAKPIIGQVIFDGNIQAYNQFIEKRKKLAYQFVINALNLS